MDKNIVREAIKKADLTNKAVAYGTRIDESSLSKICTNQQTPTPEQIELISLYLRDFDLQEQYCATYCPIGKRKNPNGFCAKDLKTLGYMIPRMLNEQQRFLGDIQKSLEDGEFSRNEEIMLSAYLGKIYEHIELMQNIASNLEKFKKG